MTHIMIMQIGVKKGCELMKYVSSQPLYLMTTFAKYPEIIRILQAEICFLMMILQDLKTVLWKAKILMRMASISWSDIYGRRNKSNFMRVNYVG